jgi:outer membrane receptor protein involved in Fe transport
MRQRWVIVGLWCGLALPARAQIEELSPLEEEPTEGEAQKPAESNGETAPVILEEFSVDERNVVLSAAKTRTTIQEAPGIITVITAEEIRERGHRTIGEVLRSVPGFEGERFDSNGWYSEAIARGQPRTLLILVNGVNVTDPVRNSLTLDSKIPIDAVKRIEVTSGPGGVIWGSNALLGIVNIILKDNADLDGAEFILGGGTGPGAQSAVKGFGAYGGKFLEGKVKLYNALSFYSDRGAELEVDATKVLGVLPAPEPDGKTLFALGKDKTDFNGRDWWLSHTLSLTLWDHLTLDWLLEFESDRRQIATGGAILRGTDASGPVTEETIGNDAMRTVGLNWRDRFLDDKFGLSAKVYAVNWELDEHPFWAFPPRADVAGLQNGVAIGLGADLLLRYGFNLDADVSLPAQNHLIFGAEAFRDSLRNATRSDRLRKQVEIPGLAQSAATDPQAARGIFGPARCPPAGRYDVDVGDGQTRSVSFSDDCQFTESLFFDTDRTVGAIYVSDEWKAARNLALQPGFRLQVSDAYDPVGLFSGAVVWNIVDKVFLKLNYAEGFRPPELQAVALNDKAISGVGYKPDPNLQVEQSRATEGELNALLFEDVGVLKRVYLRTDYAYTTLSNLVRNQGGQFANAGKRSIHSVELLARADFRGDHELWAGGHFVRSEDSVLGPIRNFPNIVLMGGGKLQILPKHLALTTLFTWVGPQEDLNRSVAAGSPLGAGSDRVITDAVDVVVDRVDSYLLLRAGLMVQNLWHDRLEFDAFVYNALNEQYGDPDFFFDDRVQTRPQPRGGWSAFGQARVRF